MNTIKISTTKQISSGINIINRFKIGNYQRNINVYKIISKTWILPSPKDISLMPAIKEYAAVLIKHEIIK